MIQVKNLTKEFKLSKQKRKEMGDEFKDVKIFKAVVCQADQVYRYG